MTVFFVVVVSSKPKAVISGWHLCYVCYIRIFIAWETIACSCCEALFGKVPPTITEEDRLIEYMFSFMLIHNGIACAFYSWDTLCH